MNFGFDLDNTLFDYSRAFDFLARKDTRLKDLTIFTKESVKESLIRNYSEIEWSKFQGKLYTECFDLIDIEDDALFLLNKLSSIGQIYVISHKTKFPYYGPKIDMRKHSISLLMKKNVIVAGAKNVLFFDTVEEKISAINSLNLKFFLDDLIEVLLRTNQTIDRGWFIKSQIVASQNRIKLFRNWNEVSRYLEENYL